MVYEFWKSEGPQLESGVLNPQDSTLEQLINKWAEKKHIIRRVKVSTCAVWDTVNSMRSKELDFVERLVPEETLENAFHCLALHETRNDFLPVLWNEAQSKTRIRECWFAGDHSDVGGGNADSGFATLTLIWMVSQFKEYTNIGFDDLMLLDCMTPQFLEWKNAEHRLVAHKPAEGKHEFMTSQFRGNCYIPRLPYCHIWRLHYTQSKEFDRFLRSNEWL